ncbi:hypothetical protein DENSPDRAFT_305166 [Dentipellis sp. KUC8613]|nr:hypothetical protein DENSPDRAFT_305166 [Dentipellis sp. KUC8613]
MAVGRFRAFLPFPCTTTMTPTTTFQTTTFRTTFLFLAYIHLFSSLLPVLGRNEITATCGPGWNWASNSIGQDPCTITTQLSQVCAKGYLLEPLDVDSSSTNPSYKGPSTSDPCQCSTVVYSLTSACAACQGATWLQWSAWSEHCPSNITDGSYPMSIPNTTSVPHWAFSSVIQNDGWSISQAMSAGEGPESTGISSAAPTSTTSASSSSSASASAASQTSSVEAQHKSSHNAAEAGIIMAVVVGVALLGGLITHLYQVYRRPQGLHGPAPTDAIYDGPPLSATEGKYPGVRYGHVSTLSVEDGTITLGRR